MKHYYKISNGKTYINIKPYGRDVIEASKPPNNYSVLNINESGDLVWEEDEKIKKSHETYIKKEEVVSFGGNLLNFFSSKIFELNSKQKTSLLSVQAYFKAKGEFPSLSILKGSEPIVWKMIIQGVKNGDLPAIPSLLTEKLKK